MRRCQEMLAKWISYLSWGVSGMDAQFLSTVLDSCYFPVDLEQLLAFDAFVELLSRLNGFLCSLLDYCFLRFFDQRKSWATWWTDKILVFVQILYWLISYQSSEALAHVARCWLHESLNHQVSVLSFEILKSSLSQLLFFIHKSKTWLELMILHQGFLVLLL